MLIREEFLNKMKQRLNKFINSSIIMSIVLITLGLFLVFTPDVTLKTISIVASIYLIMHGLILMVMNISARNIFFPVNTLMSSILSLILGLILIIYPKMLAVIIPIVLGIWIILDSINNISLSVTFRKGLSTSNFILSLLMSILGVIVGVVVLLNSVWSTVAMTVFIGISIIIYSLFNIIDMLVLKKNVKKASKKFDEFIREIDNFERF